MTCFGAAEAQRFEPPTTACKQAVSDRTPAAGHAAATQSLPGDADAPADCVHEKGLQMHTFSRAAEGIRTLDLLHGKQNVRSRASQESPAKHGFPSCRRSAMLSSSYSEIAGVSGLKPDSRPCRFGRRLRSPTAGSRAGLCAHHVSATHRSAPTPRWSPAAAPPQAFSAELPRLVARGQEVVGRTGAAASKRDSASACVL